VLLVCDGLLGPEPVLLVCDRLLSPEPVAGVGDRVPDRQRSAITTGNNGRSKHNGYGNQDQASAMPIICLVDTSAHEAHRPHTTHQT
jgi:hypothetical protein